MGRKAVLGVVVSVVFALNLAANGRHSVHGEITADAPVRFQELFVEMQNGNTPPERVSVNPDGRFEFRSVEEGLCRLRVLTMHGDSIRDEFIQVGSSMLPLTIHLRGTAVQKAGGIISARRLAHKPSKEATKAWKQAGKRVEKGDHAGAVAYLEQCIAVDPEYFEAHLNLGAERIQTGDIAGALTAYDKALEIDSSSVPALINRGMVLLHFKRAREAEETARKALTLQDAESAHYVLGLSMAVQGHDLPEAVAHLKQAVKRHPQAAKTAERIEAYMKNSLAAHQ